jgi:hypothetical protein
MSKKQHINNEKYVGPYHIEIIERRFGYKLCICPYDSSELHLAQKVGYLAIAASKIKVLCKVLNLRCPLLL